MYVNPNLLLEIYSSSSTVRMRNVINEAMPFRRAETLNRLKPGIMYLLTLVLD